MPIVIVALELTFMPVPAVAVPATAAPSCPRTFGSWAVKAAIASSLQAKQIELAEDAAGNAKIGDEPVYGRQISCMLGRPEGSALERLG